MLIIRQKTKSIAILLVMLLAWLTAAPIAHAEGMGVLRDTEIEEDIRILATPIWQAAGLDPKAVKIILVNDGTVNAFVAAGQNLFLNSGLILRAETVGQLIGVIAHETGHMSGGHLLRRGSAESAATFTSFLGILLGGVAAIATKNSSAIVAGATAGPSLGQRKFLSFSRGIEASADNAGLGFLEKSQESAEGFLQFMEILQSMESTGGNTADPYLLTHPLSNERISLVRNFVANSRYSKNPYSPAQIQAFARMKGKLSGFLYPPAVTLRNYPEDRKDIESRYARAVALLRIPDLDRGILAVDSLLKDYPKDPYFWELKGQMLFLNGRVADALPAYINAVSFKPDAALIKIDMARVMLETGDEQYLEGAIEQLQQASIIEPTMPGLWYNLGIAYGRKGDIGRAESSLAVAAKLERRYADAAYHAEKALKLLPKGSDPARQRAQDIIDHVEQSKQDDPDANS
ncbi:MAG: M48 family metalloprotease [Candidatus Pacebacteria bacterium]|nr:M48 family metalloprotease [Candidatus Paceibacterota bacterium]